MNFTLDEPLKWENTFTPSTAVLVGLLIAIVYVAFRYNLAKQSKDVIELLQTKVETLESNAVALKLDVAERDKKIAELTTRVLTLQDTVTAASAIELLGANVSALSAKMNQDHHSHSQQLESSLAYLHDIKMILVEAVGVKAALENIQHLGEPNDNGKSADRYTK